MFANVLNFVIHFALSRKLGVVDYGVFGSLLSALTIVGTPVAFITLVVVRFVAEFHAVGDRAKIRVLSQRLLVFGASLGILGVIAGVIFEGPIASYLRFSDSRVVAMAALTLAIAFALPAIRGVLQGAQDFVALAISTSIEASLKIVLAVGLVVAGWGVSGAFLGYVLASAVSFAYTMFAVRRHFAPDPAKLMIDLRRLVQTTGAIVLGTIAVTLLMSIDLPLVKHFFAAREAGIYVAVTVCGKMLLFVGGFIPTLVLPKATAQAAKGESAASVLRQGLGLALLFGLVGLALFFFLPGLIVRFTYGTSYLPAAKYIFAYGVAMSLLCLTNVVVMYKIGLHRFDFVVPLLVAVGAEAAGIYLFHSTLWSVITVVAVVNALALVLCSLRMPANLPKQVIVAPVQRAESSPASR
jgi:O-antigen/teichoic acid export membrane protein